MIRMKFGSAFREKEINFIKFKQDFGHNYTTQTYYLLDFDRFCQDKFPEADHLTEEIAMKWAVKKPSENSNGYISRINAVRQFGKYLCMFGENAFILPCNLKGGDMPLMPYIFSQGSLNVFFKFTDSMERYYQSPVRHLVAPVMLRYMYCCGLRPAEARCLKRSDVNLDSGKIFIRESKYNKERIVYAGQDLMELTMDYLRRITLIFPSSEELFVDRKGNGFSYDAHKYLFGVCRDGSKIKAEGTKQPNLYSFRHSFATHRIYKWFKEGKSIDACLPSLSAYMGHSHYSNTLYYLHFLPEIFSSMTGYDFERFSNLIPEVNEDE